MELRAAASSLVNMPEKVTIFEETVNNSNRDRSIFDFPGLY